MPTSQERTALVFLVALAATAAGVRAVGVQRFDTDVARANGGQLPSADVAARALAAQEAAVDSAARAPKRRRGRTSTPNGRRPPASRPARPPSPPKAPREEPPALVDVNTASAEELERLPRVGPALAKRIVEWRTRHGPFPGSDALRHVRGIGPSTVRLLDSLVTFSGGHRP